MTGRTFNYPRLTRILILLCTTLVVAAIAFADRHQHGKNSPLTALEMGVLLDTLFFAMLGRSTRLDERGISVRWCGKAYRRFAWPEVASTSVEWRSSGWNSSPNCRYVVVLLKNGKQRKLPLPVRTHKNIDSRFDKQSEELIATARRYRKLNS